MSYSVPPPFSIGFSRMLSGSFTSLQKTDDVLHASDSLVERIEKDPYTLAAALPLQEPGRVEQVGREILGLGVQSQVQLDHGVAACTQPCFQLAHRFRFADASFPQQDSALGIQDSLERHAIRLYDSAESTAGILWIPVIVESNRLVARRQPTVPVKTLWHGRSDLAEQRILHRYATQVR